MCEENGVLKEYYVQEHLPKRKLEGADESDRKKLKAAHAQTDKNIQSMLQKQIEKKIQRPLDELLLKLCKTVATELKPTLGKMITVFREDSLLHAFKVRITFNSLVWTERNWIRYFEIIIFYLCLC